MIFSYYVKVFDDFELKEVETRGIVFAENYGDAANKIEKYFGKDINKVIIEVIAGSNVVICSEEAINSIKDNYI